MKQDNLSALESCCERLKKVGALQPVIDNFARLHTLVAEGVTGIIQDDSLGTLDNIPSLDQLDSGTAGNDSAGSHSTGKNKELFEKLVVCKLNGGLGTSMGLKKAKSLLHVRQISGAGKLSFNQINAQQINLLSDSNLPFLNMVSFSTEDDVKNDLSSSSLDRSRQFFLMQNTHPKIYADNLHAANHEDDSLCWNPPGHGDFYQAFYASGLLESFVRQGRKYLFVSNADNLSAYPDITILNHIAKNNIPFLMEVTNRTEADKKGGHLALRKSDGRIILRESAQAETNLKGEVSGDFQNIERHKYFNLNSIWLNLEILLEIMTRNSGVLPLPLIRNKKTLDPRDSKSPEVYQLETAMGAAIEFFEGAQLLLVGRQRFAPVKTCSDLLLVLSDCYELDSKFVLSPRVNKLPEINLSSEYRMIDNFERLIQTVPSLVAADKFSISGNVRINKPLKIIGSVVIVDLRSDKTEPYEFSRDHHTLSNVRISITDQGESIEALS